MQPDLRGTGILRHMAKKKKRKQTLADKADKYRLYQRSVQAADYEVEFFEEVFKETFSRQPIVLREDFCGTAAVCCEWVKSKKKRIAIGIDLDPEPLQWGRKHNLSKLSKKQLKRISLVQADVREPGETPADLIAGQNFSYFIFLTREELKRYFRAALDNLADEGILFLDAMGGSQTFEEERQEKRKVGPFRYIWEQKRFDPITHHARMHIHFQFKDGSRLNQAFTYDWRIWSLPEIQELLREAGFSQVEVYWEGTDEKTGEGDGKFKPCREAASDPSWICYIVAIKKKLT